MKENTRLIHNKCNKGDNYKAKKSRFRSISPPIVSTSTVAFNSLSEMINPPKNIPKYGRHGIEPFCTLRKNIALLECSDYTFLTASGTQATSFTILSFLKPDDHVLVIDSCYACTKSVFNWLKENHNVDVEYYDPLDHKGCEKKIKPNTKMIFLEVPATSTFEIANVEEFVKIAKNNNIITAIDNTWASGILFKPLNYGVDISIQSLTKYTSGHSDVLMGAISVKGEKIKNKIEKALFSLGNQVSPYDVNLVLRGSKTMHLRMEKQDSNCMKVASWLKKHPKVSKILHPAFPECGGHEYFKKYFTGAGSVFTFVLNKKYSIESLELFINSLKLFYIGLGWGGFDSIISLPSGLDERTVTKVNYDNSMIRIHVGLEDPDDLISDLEQGMEKL